MKLFILALILTSCQGVTPKLMYIQPHTQAELVLAEPYVSSIVYKPWSDMRSRELGGYYGLTVSNIDSGYTIYIADYLSKEGAKEVIDHEMAHVYRLAVLGVSIEDEVAHIGWRVGR